jgi:ABC-type multidrug transport system fused ATPase/permease subunit
VLLLGLLLGAAIGLQLAGPQLQRAFIDGALGGVDQGALVALALLFIAVAVATQLVAVADTSLAESVAWSATNALRADVALHCLRLDASFHGARTPGELIERVDGDVTVLATFFSRLVVNVLGNALLLTGVLLLLVRESRGVGLAAAAFALAVLLAMLRLYARARPVWAAAQQTRALFYGSLVEHLAGAEDLRANGAVPYAERRFVERLRAWLPLTLRATLAEQVVWMVALSLFAAAEALALGLGYALLQGGAVSAGTVFLLYRYVVLLSQPVGELQAQIKGLQQAGASIERIEALLATRSRLDDSGAARLPPGPLALTLEAVSFAYPRLASPAGDGAAGGPPGAAALDALTLAVAPGRVLGLAGHTGSGKSTVARLLVRAYDPAAGTVRLGGVDVRDVPLAHLRARVGLVTQEVQLLQASVRDNLTLFDPAVPDGALLDAAGALGLGPWLDALPRGLDTELGSGGAGLSAGQAQLLALVRVFLKDPGLVVLDEPSSRLDPATERVLEGALDRLLRGRTAVVIAHRPETLRRAQEVVVLERGRVAGRSPFPVPAAGGAAAGGGEARR